MSLHVQPKFWSAKILSLCGTIRWKLDGVEFSPKKIKWRQWYHVTCSKISQWSSCCGKNFPGKSILKVWLLLVQKVSQWVYMNWFILWIHLYMNSYINEFVYTMNSCVSRIHNCNELTQCLHAECFCWQMMRLNSNAHLNLFLLNQKDLESKTILPKIFCNMHIAHRNMHIAIKSILPLTHTQRSSSLQYCRVHFCMCMNFYLHTNKKGKTGKSTHIHPF